MEGMDCYDAHPAREVAQLGSHLRSGAAAKGAHVEGAELGISHHHRDRAHGNMQLFGYLLGQRSAYVLSHFSFTGEDLHAVVRPNMNPGSDVVGSAVSFTAEAASARFLHGAGVHSADQQPRSNQLQEFATV